MINKLFRKVKKTFNQKAIARERNFLLEKMPENAVCAEIGAWKGDFTQKIIHQTKPNKLYIVDPYRFVPDYQRAWYGGKAGSQEKMDQVYESVIHRFRDEIENEKLEIKRDASKEALSTFRDQSLDWVYIDGDHTYEFVKEDLNLSWQKVKQGGFVTGDDYALDGWWKDGVTRAVDEFIDLNKDSISETFFKNKQFIIGKL